MASALSRAQFDTGALALTSSTPAASPSDAFSPARLAGRWTWIEHPALPGFGYLERRGVTRRLEPSPASELDLDADDGEPNPEGDDPAALPTAPCPSCTVNFFICFSATFHVPVLYFTAHSSSGSPLPLPSLLPSTIFHHSSRASYPFTTLSPSPDADADDPPPTPFLSQGDHPTLGTPCWFLHPCETEALVNEVLGEKWKEGGGGEQQRAEGWERDWFETWLMVVGSVIDLRE